MKLLLGLCLLITTYSTFASSEDRDEDCAKKKFKEIKDNAKRQFPRADFKNFKFGYYYNNSSEFKRDESEYYHISISFSFDIKDSCNSDYQKIIGHYLVYPSDCTLIVGGGTTANNESDWTTKRNKLKLNFLN